MGTTCSLDMIRSVPSDQVEQRKEEDPHDVDEVPVQAGDLDGRVIRWPDTAGPPHPGQPRHDPEPDHHVEGMEPGEREVEGEEYLRRVLLRSFPVEVGARHEVLVE